MLKFRPHHFLCTVGFAGQGYSDEFVKGYQEIARGLREAPDGDDVMIEVVSHTDSICTPCPNKQGLKCTTEEKVQKLDTHHASALGLRAGDRLTWGEAKQRVRERVSNEVFDKICDPCGWKPKGICEKALNQLKKVTLGMLVLLLISHAPPAYAQQSRPNILKKLSRISKEMKAGRWKSVEAIAVPLMRDTEWGDYALFALLQSRLRAVDANSAKKDWKGAAQDAEKGIQYSLQLRDRFPDSPLIKRVQEYLGLFHWAIADSQRNLKSYYLALQWLEGAPGGIFALTPEKLNRFAKLCAIKKDDLCEAWTRKLLGQFPKSASESKAILDAFAKRPIELIKPPSYSRFSQPYREAEPDQKAIDEAVAMFLSDHESDGKSALKKFLEDFPRSVHRNRAKFWLKDYESVFQENVLGNYGLLAGLKIDKKPMDWVAAQKPPAVASVVRTPGLSPRELVRLTRGEGLISSGATEFASRELEDVKASGSDLTEYLVYLATLQNQVSNHWLAFGALSELLQRSEPVVYQPKILELIFPLEGWDAIQKAALAEGVDPVLVLSLIKQESGFNARAVSGKGASGWMQMMPATAVEVDGTLNIARLSDPETNLKLGVKFLKNLLDRFHGNTAMALAGYNAGPYAAERWIKTMKPEWGMIEFVESITYRETREYVWSILRNYYWYTALRFKDKPFVGVDAFWVSHKSE